MGIVTGRARRAAAAGMIVAGIAAASFFGAAPAAEAKPPASSHSCQLLLLQDLYPGIVIAPDDDGLVTDLVHHSVEPLDPTGVVHTGSCHVQAGLSVVACEVTPLAFLGSTAPFGCTAADKTIVGHSIDGVLLLLAGG